MEKQIANISNRLLPLSDYVNKIPQVIFIFLCLALTFLSVRLNGNEEQYMQLAKQFVNPDWIYQSQNLTEVAGTRIIYQTIVGYTLKYISFEITKLLYSLLLIIGFSLCLSKIYKALSFKNLHFLFHLSIFVFFGQSFFAGSWMLISVEPKGFSYLFILLSFYMILKDRFNWTLLCVTIATYLHILVGFYTFAYILLTLFFCRKYFQINVTHLMKYAAIYVALLIPFVIYLKISALDYEISDNETSTSWIYTYFRSPHHTAIFKSFSYFITTHLSGITKAIIGLLSTIIMFPILKNDKNIRFISLFVIISLAGTLLLVSVAFFDTDGQILKFYLYRINTLSTFFLMLLIPLWAFYLTKQDYLQKIQLIIFLISSFLLIKPIRYNLATNYSYPKSQISLNALADFIKNNTASESLILNYNENLPIIRKSERSFFVSYKYIPAQLSKINDWYNRVQTKQEAKNDSLKVKELVNNYAIEYIVLPHNKKEWLDYRLIYENSDFLLLETGVKTSYNKK